MSVSHGCRSVKLLAQAPWAAAGPSVVGTGAGDNAKELRERFNKSSCCVKAHLLFVTTCCQTVIRAVFAEENYKPILGLQETQSQ